MVFRGPNGSSMKRVYRMMPELADDIPWAQDYDVGVQIDWDEDVDEEVMQRLGLFTVLLRWLSGLA